MPYVNEQPLSAFILQERVNRVRAVTLRRWGLAAQKLEAHIEALERLVREARVFIRGEKYLADWVGDAPDWEKRADAALVSDPPK